MAEHFKEPKIFASWSKDAVTRYTSTSGGIFTELAKCIINEGGLVAGARYNEQCTVEHCLVDNLEDLEKLRQSKYMSSDPKNIYREIKSALADGRLVGYCGSPCQVAGLLSYLGRDYDNLITIDFICRGMNSPKAFKAWLSEEEEKEKSRAVKVWFKYKEGGWKTSPLRTRVDYEDGHNVVYEGNNNLFMYGYLFSNLYIRPCCGDCKFKGLPRQADVTLADFWKIEEELDDDKGTSMVLVNSDKGETLLGKISQKLIIHEKSYDDIIKGNPMFSDSATVPKKAHYFLADLDRLSFSSALKKYNGHPDQHRRMSFLGKVKSKVKRLILSVGGRSN